MSEFNDDNYKQKYLKYKKKYLDLIGGTHGHDEWIGIVKTGNNTRVYSNLPYTVYTADTGTNNENKIITNLGSNYTSAAIKKNKLKDITLRGVKYDDLLRIQFVLKDDNKPLVIEGKKEVIKNGKKEMEKVY